MLIIGEKINSAIPRIREVILNKDIAFIQDLARRQAECGADFIDVNTAQGNNEVEDMEWVIKAIQEVTDVPLCIDSVDSVTIESGLKVHHGQAMLNSISMEHSRIAGMLPLIKKYKCKIIALTMDDQGIPKTAEERIRIAGLIVDLMKNESLNLEDLYIDPLVLPLAVSSENGVIFFQCLDEIKKKFQVKTVSGLSNVSHSLPRRKLINRYFLSLCMNYGMDAAIMDPLDRKLTSAISATDVLLNKDRFSRRYLKAFREEKLEE